MVNMTGTLILRSILSGIVNLMRVFVLLSVFVVALQEKTKSVQCFLQVQEQEEGIHQGQQEMVRSVRKEEH